MYKNIFIYGLSGAGKDTIARHLRDNHDYVILRIAATIKNFIYEINGFSSIADFEKAKRFNDNNIRLMHNVVGKHYDIMSNEFSKRDGDINRIINIINGELFDLEISKNLKEKPRCVFDVRTLKEAELLLNFNYFGIFLTRQNKNEVVLKDNKTEQVIWDNKEFKKLVEDNKNNIIIINNSGIKQENNKQYDFETNGSEEELFEIVDKIIKPL